MRNKSDLKLNNHFLKKFSIKRAHQCLSRRAEEVVVVPSSSTAQYLVL